MSDLLCCFQENTVVGPNKKICVFTVTCQKKSRVGRHFKKKKKLSAKPEIVIPESDSGISFSKFTVSRHLL
jgi:hypothetical protein